MRSCCHLHVYLEIPPPNAAFALRRALKIDKLSGCQRLRNVRPQKDGFELSDYCLVGSTDF